ncbi:variable surface lipoprotein [Metamycoplasma auris]|uniref:Lipoprotein n=1 Tax=Metamycoplasma auris TaxID=51363 RepID=A0A2W7G491_9BACT|nr:variable surface lipoprotein [Metamycoplasma auris]PZW01490.1 hypothetical protein BCF89_1015 [Metamycoplasma auris]
MNKMTKIFASLSLSLASLPLIAASCKKRVQNSKDNLNEKNKDSRINESLKDDSERKDIQGDEPKEKVEKEKDEPKKIEEPKNGESSSNNSNGGTYSNEHGGHPQITEEEAKKYQDERESVKKIYKVFKEKKEDLKKTKTHGEFLELLAKYVEEEGIEGISLQDNTKKDTKLEEGENKNKIFVKIGSTSVGLEL